MQNRQVITAQTARPATIPVIGKHLSHTPTLVAVTASITIAPPALIVTQAATIHLPTAVHVMTATTHGVAKVKNFELFKAFHY
jgi:hypothetical protein